MFSVRLNPTQEKHLEFLAMSQGLSKNQLVIAAVEQFLKLQDMGAIPLAEKVQESAFETFAYRQKNREHEWPKAAKAADWAQRCEIWSAKPEGVSGNVTGAIYGRNTVVGYVWPDDGNIQVLSKHLGPHARVGVAAYGYNLMDFDDWERLMKTYPTALPY